MASSTVRLTSEVIAIRMCQTKQVKRSPSPRYERARVMKMVRSSVHDLRNIPRNQVNVKLFAVSRHRLGLEENILGLLVSR